MTSSAHADSTVSVDATSFLDNLNEAFDIQTEPMSLDTEFQSLEQWDSLASVSTVAMVYSHYDVEVSGDELIGCTTVSDILALVQQRQNGAA